MNELTDTEREAEDRLRRHLYATTGGLGLPDFDVVLGARERAAVAAALAPIEAMEPTWHRGMYGCPEDMFSRSAIRAALAGGGDRG